MLHSLVFLLAAAFGVVVFLKPLWGYYALMASFGAEFVLALSDEDGSILWKTAVGPSWADNNLYPGSRSTPTIA